MLGWGVGGELHKNLIMVLSSMPSSAATGLYSQMSVPEASSIRTMGGSLSALVINSNE